MPHSTSPAPILVSASEIYHSLMPLGSPQSISQKMFLPFQVDELNPCVTSMKRKLFLICMVEIPCWLTTVASGVSV